jgi:hypothetical protein
VGLDAQVLGYKLGAGAGTTAGQAAQKLYSCSGASGDVVQTTAASQPLLLVHSGANYFQGVGVNLNFVRTPNAAANNFTGDIDIRVRYQPKNVSSQSQLLGKFNGSVYPYNFYQWTSKRFIFETNYGTVTSSSHTFNNDDIFWARVTRQASNGEIIFYTSVDGTNWTLLSTHTQTSGSLATGGDLELFSADPMTAKYYRVTLSNSIGGAPVVDFNPNQYNAATSQTQWTSSTGEVWTINTGTATSGYKGVLVNRTIVQADGIGDTMVTSVNVDLSTTSNLTLFTSYRKLDSTDGTYEILVHNGTANFGSGSQGYFVMAIANGVDKIFTRITRNSLNSDSDITDANYLLKMAMIKYINNTNPASISNKFNNVTKSSSNSFAATNGAFMNQVIRLFSNIGTSSFANTNLNTLILSSNTTDYDTSMYNYIRSINNNAF